MSPLPSRYKIILPVIVFGAAALLCIFVGYKTIHEPPVVTTTAPIPVVATSTTSDAPRVEVATTSKIALPPTTPADYIAATLSVGGTNYPLATAPNSTVESAMKLLESQNSSFTFTEKSFPDLGEFIESLNGKANSDGYYWFLYVNGKDSATGMSQTIIHAGDVIEWRYMHQ